MAYQPKSYRKFVATAATATLVAGAIAPIASAAFSDVSDKYKDAVDFLVSKGANGITETSFGVNEEITRVDAAVLIVKVLGLDIEAAPASGFTDVPARAAKYVNALKAAGITNGKTATSFDASSKITRGELAVWIQKGFDLKGDGSVNFTDVSDRYKEAVSALVANKITNGTAADKFGTTQTAKRGDYAIFLYKAANDVTPVAPEVKSVSAINHKELKLTGAALDVLKAENFSVEGNKVANYEVSEDKTSATVTFEKSFENDKEAVLKVTEKVEGQEDKVTEFKFTYSLNVASVAVKDVRIDGAKDKQFLSFNINNESIAANVEQLKASGYTVEFQTTQEVLVDASTGEIDESKVAPADKFAYKVVLTKGETTIESELKEVKVLDFDTHVSNIGETKLSQGDVKVTSGKVSVQDGIVALEVSKVSALSGATVASPTLTYKSSNPAVATIDGSGNITPIKPGSVVFTVTSDDAKVEVPVTVVSGARVATTVATSTNTVKLFNGNTDKVATTVTDQYGDEFEGDVVVTSKNTEVTNATPQTVTVVDGKVEFDVVPVASAKGSTTLEIKNADSTKLLKTVSVQVSDDSTVASRKVEVANPAADFKLDVVHGSDDTSVDILWNTYNKDGFKIGSQDLSTYTVTSSNTAVATADIGLDDKTVTVTGKKAGTTTISIKEGTVTRASVTITVVNSTPTITNVKFEELKDITAVGALADAVALKPEKITLSDSTYKAQLDTNGDIYVDLDENGTKDPEEVLATLAVKYSGTSSDWTTAPAIASGSVTGTVAASAEGTLVVYVTATGEVVPLATTTINVKTN